MKITKTHLSRIIQEELAATNLQEAPLPADEYKETVEYLWSQNLSHIVLPFKHATNLDGEFPPAIKTIVDYWEKKDFKGMASEFISLRDELDEWLKSRGFNWSIRTEKDPGSRYVDYSIDGRKGRTSRDSIDTNFKHAFRLIRMLINNPPPSRGYTGFGVANSNPSFMRQQAIDADTLGHRQTQEGKNKMKITKTHLAQIIQEEVAKSIEEGMMDAIGAIKDKLSPKRPSPAKAPAPRERNKHEKKQWRQQGGADAYDFNLGMLERPNFPNDKDYMEGWNDSLQEGKNKIKITKSTLAQIVQEELTAMKAEGYGNYKRDDNDWGDLEENEIYALEALRSLGGEQPAGDIAAIASDKYENAIGTEKQEDFGADIQTALDSLQDKGKVRLTQGEPGSGVEAFYALV